MPPRPHHVPSIASILLSPTPSTSNDSNMDTPPSVNPPEHAPPSDNRPPGGTRRSGHKTPRKVQWVFDEAEGSPSTRALDEHALDPEAFETLTTALERHRSSSMSEGSQPHLTLHTAPTAISPEPSLPTSPELTRYATARTCLRRERSCTIDLSKQCLEAGVHSPSDRAIEEDTNLGYAMASHCVCTYRFDALPRPRMNESRSATLTTSIALLPLLIPEPLFCQLDSTL
ncbi:hypothetical protein NUW54_g13938 [Trametes sanguinea]|uniref:Uncharacterized protein n=1 Tax=Trametes sanguinea TaxID=158606 RepID=A0ACC1MG45_9APHY|nr:hypothetical protein NUW54_g13938 [Trametes sanguinea]